MAGSCEWRRSRYDLCCPCEVSRVKAEIAAFPFGRAYEKTDLFESAYGNGMYNRVLRGMVLYGRNPRENA